MYCGHWPFSNSLFKPKLTSSLVEKSELKKKLCDRWLIISQVAAMREEMMEVVAKEVAALRAEVKEFLFFVDFVKKIT